MSEKLGMTDLGLPPVWPPQAIFTPGGLSSTESAIEPRGWCFVASDGYPLAVLTWPVPSGVDRRGRVMVLHGVQSHAGWYHGLGRRLAARGYEVHVPDRRGSGANTRDRGHTPSAKRLIDDLRELNDGLRAHDGGVSALPHALAGISWGGKLVVSLAMFYPEEFQALALICPGLHPRVGVGAREKLGVALALISGRAATRHFAIPLADPALFTADPAGRSFIKGDPLSLRTASAGLLFASRVLDGWVRRAPSTLETPLLLMLAGHDRIVDNDRTRQYFGQVASPGKRMVEYPEGHHTFEFGPEPARYAHDLADWLDANPSRSSPVREAAS